MKYVKTFENYLNEEFDRDDVYARVYHDLKPDIIELGRDKNLDFDFNYTRLSDVFFRFKDDKDSKEPLKLMKANRYGKKFKMTKSIENIDGTKMIQYLFESKKSITDFFDDDSDTKWQLSDGNEVEMVFQDFRGMAGEPVSTFDFIINKKSVDFNKFKNKMDKTDLKELKRIMKNMDDENSQQAKNWAR